MKKQVGIAFLFLICSWFQPYQISAQIRKDTTEARQFVQKADSLFEAASYEENHVFLKQAASLYQKYSSWKNYFSCEARIAETLLRQGKYEEASLLVQTSVQQVSEKKLANTESEALLLNQQGLLFMHKGRNDLALENFQKAITVFSSLKKIPLAELASCYNNLGLAHWNAGNNQLALEHLQKSLSLRKELYGEEDPEVASSYNNLGLIYSANDPTQALEHYSKALEIYKKYYGENHPNVAIALNNIAIIQRKQKKYDEALTNFQKVLNAWEAMNKTRHPNTAFVYTNVGQVYSDKGESAKALEFHLRALEIYRENYGAKHPEIAGTYNEIGTIYASDHQYKKALESYQQAICANLFDYNQEDYNQTPPVRNYYNANVLLHSLLMKARTLEMLYTNKTIKPADLRLAATTFYACDTLIEKIRKVQTNKNDKIELGKVAASVYEDAIRVCLTLREGSARKNLYNEKAFYFAEKSKTAVLLEAISDASAKHFASIPDSLLEKENTIKTEISFYEQKLAEKNDAAAEQTLRDKLFSLNRQYETFITDLEKRFPDYYNLKYNVKTTSVNALRQVLPAGSALVSYFIAEESKRVYIFFITPKKFQVYDVAANEELNKLLTGYRNSIRFDVPEVFADLSNQLYKQLIPFPLSSSLKKLIVIPDGRLGTIPFEAFLTEKINTEKTTYVSYPFLVKKCAISYSYSAHLYEQGMHKKSKADGSIFLCAPVEFKGMSSLPATREEVNKIDALFTNKGFHSNCYTGKNVQESFIKSGTLSGYHYLHFATHGVVDEHQPELSEIYLSPDTTKREDGNLYSGEIYNLKINADLVTLSACQTGLGKVQKGEGIIGLTRALLYAGANNLVVSLWSVADKSTSELMIDFYSRLLNNTSGADYSTALQNAKLSMIRSEQYNKPYYWAPFILIGK